jgi:restriction system protein
MCREPYCTGGCQLPRSLASSAPFRVVRAGDDAPAITLKAVLDFGENRDDGRLVQSVKLPLFLIMRMIQRNPESIYDIDWRTWEEIIAGAYFKDGFEVILTPRSGDDGRDVIAIKKGNWMH